MVKIHIMLNNYILFNHRGHNRALGHVRGRTTRGWLRRGEMSGSERVKEHGGDLASTQGIRGANGAVKTKNSASKLDRCSLFSANPRSL